MQTLRDVTVNDDLALPAAGSVYDETFISHRPYTERLPLCIGRERLNRWTDSGPHINLDFYSLRLVRVGRGIHIVNGHPYSLTRGDIYITPLRAVHSYRDCLGIEMDAFYFQANLLTRDELAALQAMSGFWKLFTASKAKTRRGFIDQRLHLSPERHREVENVIERLRAEVCEPGAIGPIAARNRFFCLLATLARWRGEAEAGDERDGRAERPDPGFSQHHAAELSEVIEYCDGQFASRLTVPELAAKMWLSPDHFARLFCRETGVPPATYIRRLRLERAQFLLRTTSLKIPEIALACGFNDGGALTRAFNAGFGTGPARYRRGFRQNR